MFKGMQNILQKIGQKAAEMLGDVELHEIFTAPELLSGEGRARLLNELPILAGISTQDYNALYLKVIYNFAEFVQNLPETKSSYYSYAGGLLDHALDRSYRSLAVTRAYLLSGGASSFPMVSANQALWIYAVFTASLLLDVGKVAVKLMVDLCNYKGDVTKQWMPFEGSMLSQPPATHYRFEFEKENRERLKRLGTSLLARQLMPEAGFNQLASDKNVLEAWLAILDGDQSGGGLMPHVIPLADAQVLEWQIIRRELAEPTANPAHAAVSEQPSAQTAELPPLPKKRAGVSYGGQPFVAGTGFTIASASTTTILGAIQLSTVNTTLPAGVAFLKWLMKGIQNKSIAVSGPKASVERIADGLFLLPKIFAEFSKSNPMYKDPHAVAKEFVMLDVTHMEQGYRYFPVDAEPRIIKNAVVIKNNFLPLIFSEAKVFPPINESVVPMQHAPFEMSKSIVAIAESLQKVESPSRESAPMPEISIPTPKLK